MTSAADIARALIRRPSVTPQEAGALDLLAGLLQPAGFRVERAVFSEPGWPDVENLYARIGSGAPVLAFAGHVDVVPPGDAARWRFDPFSGELADGMIWGRGAVDMKGGLAACVAAALDRVAASPPPGSIVFLITSDEEGPAVNGTVKLLRWAHERGERFDHCLLAEPTSERRLGDTIKIGRRGSLSGSVMVHGRQGHVAYPHLADNPIPTLARIVSALLERPLDGGDAHFAPSRLEFTNLEVGNPSANVIPAGARAAFNIRFNGLWTADRLADEVRRRVAVAAQGAQTEVVFAPSNASAFLTEPSFFVDLLTSAIRAECGIEPDLSTAGGTSDARFIKDYCPVVEFGLVNETLHAVDERASVEDLEALARIFRRVLEQYFGQGPGWSG